MHGRSCARLLAVSLLILWPLLSSAQVYRSAPARQPAPELASQPAEPWRLPVPDPIPVIPALHLPGGFGFDHVARAAGIIFSGTVTRIERRPATRGQSVETVAITFHIEQAIRGAVPGGNLTILQWIGLWSSGQRYRVGERVFLFLYPPSKLGLTSSVAGPIGRFNIDARGHIMLSAQHLAAFRKDPVLGGKSRARFSDFALAVTQAGEEE